MENIEREIRFRLARDGGPLVKSDSYHAIIEKRVDRSCSLKDSDHMGSTAKVVVLAAQP